MNNRFNQQRERGPPPHLDVRSQNLVYLTGVPTAIGGKELKNRLANQFGQIKFVETFEAWLRRLTGNIVIDFTTYDDSEAFMTAVINGRIQFLDGAGVQHIGIVGARHFFELIHRNTDIDLFYCDGKPNADWVRNRRPRASGGKPYERPAPRPLANPPGTGSNMVPLASAGPGPNRQIPPRNVNQNSGVKSGGSGAGGGPSNNAQPIRASGGGSGARRDRNSPSDEDDEMVGPFPTSSSVSASLRRLIKFSIWQSQATGKAHILQFCSPNKQNDGEPRTRPSSPLPGMIYGKRRSRTPLPVSTRNDINGDNNWTPRRRSASAHRRPQRSISPPQFFQHRPRISSFHQPKPQQFANKNGHLNNYNFQWSQGRSPERSGDHAAIASRIEPAPMVVGLDLTKERMRQTRRQHHRYLRTPSPQFLFGHGSNNGKRASGEIQGPIQTQSRHPHLYQQQANPPQPMTPFSSGSFSAAGHSFSFTANAGGHLFSPIRGTSNGLFMFRALSSNAKRGRGGGQFGRGGGGPIHRNNLWKNDYEMFWPKHRRGAANKRGQMRKNGLEPDIILIDDSPEGTNRRSSGIGHSSFFSTPSFSAKPTKKAKHLATTQKVHRNREELEEGELTDETDDEGIDDGIIGREEPMEIDEEHEGKEAEENEEKSKEVEEEEEEEFNIDEYEAPFEFVEDDDEVQQQPEKENNQKGGEEEANDGPADGDGEQIENNNNVGGANIDDILDGISVGDLNEIDENALLGETDDEQQQEEEDEDEEEEEGDQRPAAQKSNSSLEQSPQNSQIGDDDEILVLGVRRISIDAGNGQNATTGGGGPIGIGRKGQRIQLVKSEIMEPAEMGGDGTGSSGRSCVSSAAVLKAKSVFCQLPAFVLGDRKLKTNLCCFFDLFAT